MALDIQKMKDRLDQLRNPKSGGNKNILRLQDGKTVVRLLPTEDGDPFKAFYVHYSICKERCIVSKSKFW